MRPKTRILALILPLAMLGLLAACGNDDDAVNGEGDADAPHDDVAADTEPTPEPGNGNGNGDAADVDYEDMLVDALHDLRDAQTTLSFMSVDIASDEGEEIDITAEAEQMDDAARTIRDTPVPGPEWDEFIEVATPYLDLFIEAADIAMEFDETGDETLGNDFREAFNEATGLQLAIDDVMPVDLYF